MEIFNSLGSSYNFRFAVKALFIQSKPKHSEDLRACLETRYGGRATLLYKGREAMLMALRLLDLPKGTHIVVTGYTCFAVYRSVVDAGLQPVYLDVATDDLNFSVAQVQVALQQDPAIKVLIIQNTLGYPCDGEKIAALCAEAGVTVIEDLAHSIGATYAGGAEVGTIGDFTVLSFSQDKVVDGISGGALVVRNSKYQDRQAPVLGVVPVRRQLIDRWYPIATWLIRTTYQSGIGKILHLVLRKLNLLPQPVGSARDVVVLQSLPHWYAGTVARSFKKLDSNLAHRRKIARVYVRNLSQDLLFSTPASQIERAVNLRFPIHVKNRKSLVAFLKKRGVHVSDTWYDAPIAPAKYMDATNYRNECPAAEEVSATMVNLPTHQNLTEREAKRISKLISVWQIL